MSPLNRKNILRVALLPLAAAVIAFTGCGGGTMTTATQSSSGQTGPAFLIGTDAPLASVVSMKVTLESVELTNSSTSTATLVQGTPTVDFARYNGLQEMVDMTDVPAGTYTGVTFVLGTGTVSWLNTSGGGAPTVSSAPAAFTPSTVTVSLPTSLVVGDKTPPVGVRLDFDLGKSIATSGGQIVLNGSGDVEVNPTFDITTVAKGDAGAHIDELIGGLVSVPTGTNDANPASFMIQGPHGENFTINTSGSTAFDGGATLSELTTDGTSAVVEVAGVLDPSDQTLDADEVAILTDNSFYARGMVTYVNPTSGPATAMDFYVRDVLPSQLQAVPLGGLADVNISGNENYGIYWMHNAFTEFLFNQSAMIAGQEIAVGGPDPSGSGAFSVKRIHLENWGYNGTITGTPNQGQGTFTMTVTGFAGQLIPETITVYLGPACDFRYGLGELGFPGLTTGASIRVVGVLLKNPTDPTDVVLVARHIDGLTFTDFTTAAWE